MAHLIAKRLKTTFTLVLIGIAVVCVVRVATLWETPQPHDFTIEITGTEGRAVEARIEVDGDERFLKSTIPAKFTVEAHRLSWEVKRLDGPEQEKFKVAVRTPLERDWDGGSAESDRVLRGGLVGPSGLRRSRAWHGRFHE